MLCTLSRGRSLSFVQSDGANSSMCTTFLFQCIFPRHCTLKELPLPCSAQYLGTLRRVMCRSGQKQLPEKLCCMGACPSGQPYYRHSPIWTVIRRSSAPLRDVDVSC